MKTIKGFLKAEGRRLINGDGDEVLLRGVGLGSFLLPEGYMWCFPHKGDRPRRMEGMIVELIGDKKAEQFWETYYERYISEEDIIRISKEGFNSIRVPINSRFILKKGETTSFNEEHLLLIDRVINWCRTNGLYVILDLHGAPGGQTGTNIDDSENNKPELFIYEKNKRLTIDIWRMFAKRYKNEWIVAGYDLLNEPLPQWFSEYNENIMPLYEEIIKAIRAEDKDHMIILEGVHWATDWSIFTEKIDDNLMLQFHKYWNNPDTESIGDYLKKREELNVPIFMGEGGENNANWYTGAFRLFEDHNISWNFWTWKKMNTTNSPCSINMPRNWNLLVSYLEGGAKPSSEAAEEILCEYLNNISFDNCKYYKEVVNSIFSRVPVCIPSIFYGYHGRGKSYWINKESEQNIGFRINDGIDIRFIKGARTIANFEHGRGEALKDDEKTCIKLSQNEWTSYEFSVEKDLNDSFFTIGLNMSAPNSSGRISILIDDLSIVFLEAVGRDWNVYFLKEACKLKYGTHRVIIKAEENAVLLEEINIILASIS
ncbi:MAG: glycoside hydrolase family 5 protein [Clostridium sp.]